MTEKCPKSADGLHKFDATGFIKVNLYANCISCNDSFSIADIEEQTRNKTLNDVANMIEIEEKEGLLDVYTCGWLLAKLELSLRKPEGEKK